MEFREKVGKRVDAAHYLEEVTFVTKGKPGELRAVLIPPKYYEALERALAEQGITLPSATMQVGDE
ncbi:hypothetical protein [Micromonospora carbonacea]|uniref:hypothetical protein n=1 Tax=Micromonospora carbonacea TaxID=47853 RepID=UPI00371609AE